MHTPALPAENGLRPTIPPNAESVVSTLRRAADETGTDFGYLLTTAMRESSLNPRAEAATSTAAGLFQFIEQTWLGTLKAYGAEHGLAVYAEAIQVGSNGRFRVADAGLKEEILALRKDARTAALMAGEMTNETRGDMEAALGRGVSAGELYVAHFLGPAAAIKLIKAGEATPEAPAADIFPQAAAANRTIFYGEGRARSAADVLAALTAKHDDAPPGDMMVAAADIEPAAVEMPPPALSDWRTAVAELAPAVSSFARFAEHVTVMAPVMVQILAALDPTPHLAMPRADDEEPQLRRSAEGLI
jgi:hypothetical protein